MSFMSGSAKPAPGNRREVFLWYYMRWSGLLLVFLALFHLWLNHIHTDVRDLNYDLVITRLSTWPILIVVDFLLLFLGLGHGVNGLKNLIDDHVHEPAKRNAWLTLLFVTFSAFLVAGTAVLFTLDLSGEDHGAAHDDGEGMDGGAMDPGMEGSETGGAGSEPASGNGMAMPKVAPSTGGSP
ncbi:MAG: hypothetical protein ACPGQL_00135 [Thermoplasmatota archaeon]